MEYWRTKAVAIATGKARAEKDEFKIKAEKHGILLKIEKNRCKKNFWF